MNEQTKLNHAIEVRWLLRTITDSCINGISSVVSYNFGRRRRFEPEHDSVLLPQVPGNVEQTDLMPPIFIFGDLSKHLF